MAMALLQLPTPTGCVVLSRSCVTPKSGVLGVAFSDRMCITSGGKGQQELNRPWRMTERGAREVVRRRSAEAASGSSVDVATAGGVTEVDKDTFWPFVEEAGEKVVVLDMYTQWCGPCKLMLPKVIKLSETYDDVAFAKLDCNQENKPLAKELGVKSVPTFKIFKNAKVVAEIRGAKFDDLVSAIEKARSLAS